MSQHILLLLTACLTFVHIQAQISVVSRTVNVDETAGSITITVTYSPPPTSLWGFTAFTMDGTATAPDDYTAIPNMNFARGAGIDTVNITISIIDDMIFDPDETFYLNLTGLSTGQVDISIHITIIDNERKPVELKKIDEMKVKESIGNFTFTISRNDTTRYDFNVSVSTMDSTMGNMATAGQDYIPLDYLLVSFGEDEDDVTVHISIIDDEVAEEAETFCVIIYGLQIANNVTFYVTIEDNDTPDNFNCGRGVSQPCLNDGNCTFSDGTCDCPMGFAGENCGIDEASVTTGCDCVNGTCVTSGADMKCVCDGGFAGEMCDKKAYFHKCEANGFSVCITPFSVATFSGRVYVSDKQTVDVCNLGWAPHPPDPDDNIVDWCKGIGGFISYNSTCGELGPDEMYGVTTFRLVLRVQYSNLTRRSTDEIVTFLCQYDNESLVATASVSTFDADESHTNVQRERGELVPAVLTTLNLKTGAPVQGTLKVGVKIRLCVSVSEVDAFGGVVIDRIVASNHRAPPDYTHLILYDTGCTPNDAIGIISKGPYFYPPTERHTMCFNLVVFIFLEDINDAVVNTKLKIDIYFTPYENAADADEHVCSNSGRKKRQADRENKLETTFYLINPNVETQGALQDVSSTCSCSSWLVPALIGLGIVAITMAVVIIALTIVVCRYYKEKKLP